MSDLATPRGFEDLWRQYVLPRWRSGPSSNGRLMRQELSLMVRGAPSPVLRASGVIRSKAQLVDHLRYISRGDEIELTGRDGEKFLTRAERLELADDWAADDVELRRDQVLVRTLVASMPPGAPLEPMVSATHAFLRDAIGERFDFATAAHSDAKHPHLHVAVRVLGTDCERFHPYKRDFYAWRQQLAEQLRAHGIEAQAAPRALKGQVRAHPSSALHRTMVRTRDRQGPLPHVTKSALSDAVRDAAMPATTSPTQARIASDQGELRRGYMLMADALDRNGGDDALLAKALRAFVGRMPGPLTRRTELEMTARTVSARRLEKDFRVGRDDTLEREAHPGREAPTIRR